ncbi:hypothetical protein D7V83_19855 [bacterium 0.1xD8-71]|nr:hypothetical protein D7V83_19855 [bacterium 0.1xD8-71]
MKYLLLELNKEKYWLELDDERYANRQIILDECNKFHVSCMEDCLAEGIFNEADVEGNIINLAKQDFEDVWQSVLNEHKKQWKEIKQKYPVGVCVQGVNSYSYPQGTIVKGRNFIAIYTGDQPFYYNKCVQYKVKAYDDINMWLIVE